MIYLISIKTLKDEYLIDDNIEDKYILSNIQKGQRFIINGILGDDKYNEIINQVSSGTTTAQNKLIIENYIQPILAYYVMSEVVYTTAYKLKNVGIENASSDRFNELVKISQKYLKDSEQFQQLLKDYICDNNISLDEDGKHETLKTGLYIEKHHRHFKTDGSGCFYCD